MTADYPSWNRPPKPEPPPKRKWWEGRLDRGEAAESAACSLAELVCCWPWAFGGLALITLVVLALRQQVASAP